MRHLMRRRENSEHDGKEHPRRLSELLRVYRRRWFQVFAVGLALLALMEGSFLLTRNPNLVPAMIL